MWNYFKTLIRIKWIQFKFGKFFKIWFAIKHPNQYARFKMYQNLLEKK